jgi:hypothetical protein
MKSSSCSFKLLEKAYIGERVRMTGDKKTLPFPNAPMKDVKIIKYDKMGFELTHPQLPKVVYLDFKQLPLLSLTIINGVIKDEITFVENIIAHQVEFIKTDMLDYLELLDLKNRESEKTFVTLKDLKPGDVIITALCESGEPMIYLGTWYTKQIKSRYHYNYGYSRQHNQEYEQYTHHMYKVSPRRAFFLIKSAEGKKYKIMDYPVTAKFITNMVPQNKNIPEFNDLKFNKDFAFFGINNNKKYNFTLQDKWKKNVNHLLPNYPLKEDSYYGNDTPFLTESKDNIDTIARAFFTEYYGIKVAEELY